MSTAIRTARYGSRAVPTRRQELAWAIENGVRRPGPDASYADGDDATWMQLDWPSMTRRVPVLGREVNVVDTGGAGPPLLFVHGLGGCWQNWLLNIPAFMGGHRVIALDLPGFGESEMPAEEISIRGYAKVIDALCDELGVESVSVIGNSMGGFVGAELALSFPTRVERLVLVVGGRAVDRVPAARAADRGRAPVDARAPPGSARVAAPPVVRPRGAAAGHADARALSGEAVAGADLRAGPRAPGKPGFMPALDALLDHSYRDRLARIEIPVAGRLGPQRHARAGGGRARVRRADRRQRAAGDLRGHRPPADDRAPDALQRGCVARVPGAAWRGRARRVSG